MDSRLKVDELKQMILSVLIPLVDSDYIYLDLPYHSNIGDTLIWQGTEDFLSQIVHKCVYKSASIVDLPELDTRIVIILHGGGNFGDVWRFHSELRNQVIERYPDNRIIILPQTIHYNSIETLKEDASLMSKHKDLHICARDVRSKELLDSYFQNNHYLLPDMAFCINVKNLKDQVVKSNKIGLFLKRIDKELGNLPLSIPEGYEVRDWPTIEASPLFQQIFNCILRFKPFLGNRVVDLYANHIYRPLMVKCGVRFVSQYQDIHTTRLHVAILSVLLGKAFTFYDNSYGKNSQFYHTWLFDIDTITLMK